MISRAGRAESSYLQTSTGSIISIFTALLCAMAEAQGQERPVDAVFMRSLAAKATVINGQVTGLRDGQPWAISEGDQIPVQQVISTGVDTGREQLRSIQQVACRISQKSRGNWRSAGSDFRTGAHQNASRVRPGAVTDLLESGCHHRP